MAWFDEAVFYHIYPLGLTGAPRQNSYSQQESRLNKLYPWVDHIRDLGFSALYIGPLFESVGHGYETTDYYRLDSRLGDNEDLKKFVAYCHQQGIRVVLDGVFNHTGRDFFAFRDLQQYRENSRYRDWYCKVNFWGNNSYHDGFSYENWGGYDLLVKLNQRNPEVQQYICDVIRFWVSEFDIDGIRLDAADVLDFDFMQAMRRTANEVKQDFWLMGEVIHGDYNRWVNDSTLHSVTNYSLHKALFSGHNDHNYFEIAHTIRQQRSGSKYYNFVDNHDVERIHTKLRNKAHFTPVHILLYTLPGIPSVYYGSEFAVDGKKNRWSDDSLRPALHLEEFQGNPQAEWIGALGKLRRSVPALSYGAYQEKVLTNTVYAFARNWNDASVIVTVNNGDDSAVVHIPHVADGEYVGALSGKHIRAEYGTLSVEIPGCGGDIWVPTGLMVAEWKPVAVVSQPKPRKKAAVVTAPKKETPAQKVPETSAPVDLNKPYEQMSVEELQAAVLQKLSNNGPLTDRMRREVAENVYRDSLLNWVRSFR